MTRLVSVVLCDDVREETSGKRTLVGVYGTELLASQRPALVSLQVHTIFEFSGDACDLEIEVVAPGRTTKGSAKVPAGHQTAMLTAPLKVFFEEPTEVVFRWRHDGKRWSSPVKWHFKFTPDAQELDPDAAEEMRKALR